MVATNDRIHRINRLTSARRDRITRSSRVRLLSEKVAEGSYEVDAHALADVLVRRALFHRHVLGGLLDERSPSREV
ncbi:MAG: flagellar biosynthesis anti-sigma factor FlgM [Conexibacter sp.]